MIPEMFACMAGALLTLFNYCVAMAIVSDVRNKRLLKNVGSVYWRYAAILFVAFAMCCILHVTSVTVKI